MPDYEYKVVPAPTRGEKVKGLKRTSERFAYTMSGLLNTMAREGWEYFCSETLPCEQRKGLFGTTTTYQNMLIFRRSLPETIAITQTPGLSATGGTPEPAPATPTLSARREAAAGPAPLGAADPAPPERTAPAPDPAPGAAPPDSGGDETDDGHRTRD